MKNKVNYGRRLSEQEQYYLDKLNGNTNLKNPHKLTGIARLNELEALFFEKLATELSWAMNDKVLKNQVNNYTKLEFTKTYRGKAVIFISILWIITIIYYIFNNNEIVILPLLLFLPILFFTYKGHRWAIIFLMLLWTIDRILAMYYVRLGSVFGFLWQIFLWYALIAYLWKALKIENERMKILKSNTKSDKSKFCHKCGYNLKKNSSFCSKCGIKL